jgi:hypothetical protein
MAKPLSYLCLCLFFLTCFSVQAQKKKHYNIKRYFKDPIGSSKNLIKTDIFALSRGELSLHYERMLSPKISLEIQYGRFFGYYSSVMDNFVTHESVPDNVSGYSYGIQFRNYITSLAPERYYTSFLYRYRKLDIHYQGQMDITGGIGMQNFISNYFMWDLSLMSGTRLRSNNSEEQPTGKGVPLIYLQAKIAYLF